MDLQGTLDAVLDGERGGAAGRGGVLDAHDAKVLQPVQTRQTVVQIVFFGFYLWDFHDGLVLDDPILFEFHSSLFGAE